MGWLLVRCDACHMGGSEKRDESDVFNFGTSLGDSSDPVRSNYVKWIQRGRTRPFDPIIRSDPI